jgi:DNA-binding response OmpR family regulator
MMGEKPNLKILLVEDDENDVLFLKRALKASCAAIELDVARDGELAVQYLSGKNGAALPDRIILDLKLPRRSGTDVLAWIRSQPSLRHLSVTVMTSSSERADIERVRHLGVDDYIVKPVSYQGLLDVAAGLCTRWGVASPSRRETLG